MEIRHLAARVDVTIVVTVARPARRRASSSAGGRTSRPSRECTRDLAFYVGAGRRSSASASGSSPGTQYGGEFFAGWLTEYSLSVDNLFIFIIIMAKFAVPRQYQQTALLVGIVLALVMRGIFIAVGAAAINQFSWVFYLFGAFLVYTAVKLARDGDDDDEDEYEENRAGRGSPRRTSRRPRSRTASSCSSGRTASG